MMESRTQHEKQYLFLNLKKNLYGSFLWVGFSYHKASATSRRHHFSELCDFKMKKILTPTVYKSQNQWKSTL